MKKTVVVLFLILLLCHPVFAAATLRVATSSTYPPYEFLNTQGQLDGFDIDLMKEISRRISRNLQWADMGYDMVIPELISGRSDVICAGMSATPIRAKRVMFTVPYSKTVNIFMSAIDRKIETLKDLKGLRGAVPVGTTQDVFLTPLREKYRFTLKLFPKMEDGIWDIVTGRSDFTLMDVPVGEKMVALPHFQGKVSLGGKIILSNGGKALAVRKDDFQLKSELDGALNSMEKDGTLPILRKRWHIDQ